MPDGAMQPAPLLPPHAPYHERPAEFRIGLAPIPVEQWFEGGEPDPAPRKDALLAAHEGLVWREVEGSRPAQAEALAMISAWLGRPTPPGGDPSLLAAARLVADDL